MLTVAMLMDAAMRPIEDQEFCIESEKDFERAVATAREVASNWTRCCIQWHRKSDGKMAFWGPQGAISEPYWYSLPLLDWHLGQDAEHTHVVWTRPVTYRVKMPGAILQQVADAFLHDYGAKVPDLIRFIVTDRDGLVVGYFKVSSNMEARPVSAEYFKRAGVA